MKACIAEKLVQPAITLHIKPDIIFVSHTNAAVHLHTFAHRKVAGIASLGFGHRDKHFSARITIIEQLLGFVDHRTRGFHFTVEVRGTVLERLEFANELAKLLAGFEIGKSRIHCSAANASHFRSGPNPASVKQLCKHAPARINLTNHSVSINMNAVKCKPRSE